MADPKTPWERAQAALGNLGDHEVGEGWHVRTGLSCAVEFLCNELDAANRRIAELERNLAEMARGKR